MFRLTAAALTCTITLAACAVAPVSENGNRASPKQELDSTPTVSTYTVAPPNAPSGAVVDTFARNFLNTLQPLSIRERTEYCGYIFVDGAGNLQATPPVQGTFAGCNMFAPERGQGIIASYHTHGAYNGRYDNEVPSVIDLESDFIFGIDGYVSTPGGRVWLVDFQTLSTQQICGRDCVFTDPGFVPHNEDNLQQNYTVQTLRQRQSFI